MLCNEIRSVLRRFVRHRHDTVVFDHHLTCIGVDVGEQTLHRPRVVIIRAVFMDKRDAAEYPPLRRHTFRLKRRHPRVDVYLGRILDATLLQCLNPLRVFIESIKERFYIPHADRRLTRRGPVKRCERAVRERHDRLEATPLLRIMAD